MNQIVSFFNALWEEQYGQDLLEYALIGCFTASVAVAAFPPALAAMSGLLAFATRALDIALSATAAQ